MSRRLVEYETGVTSPDGYRERANEYVYTCDMCQRERETYQVEQDLCEDCLMTHENAPELRDALLKALEAVRFPNIYGGGYLESHAVNCRTNALDFWTEKDCDCWLKDAKAALKRAGVVCAASPHQEGQ